MSHIWVVEVKMYKGPWRPHARIDWFEKRDEARKVSNGDPELRTVKYERDSKRHNERSGWIIETRDSNGRWKPHEEFRLFSSRDEARDMIKQSKDPRLEQPIKEPLKPVRYVRRLRTK